MNLQDEINSIALKNYSASTAWPQNDAWHNNTFSLEKKIVEKWLKKVAKLNTLILNAGSGGTEYNTEGTLIHLDIIEKNIKHFEKHIVGSVEDIALDNESVDGIICVGSVLNYADAQRTISEFSRILKPNGFFIIEFERSDSAEFLCTLNHGKAVFAKEYHYNCQTHLLWLYSERHIRQLIKHYNLNIAHCKRIHSLSSLLNRFGISEEKAAKFSKFDILFQPFSYHIAHNVLFLGTKNPFGTLLSK